MVHNKPTSASITNVSTSDWHLLCSPSGVGSWPWRICRLWLVETGACGKNDIPVLCVITSTTPDTTLSTNGYIPDSDCRHGDALPAGLSPISITSILLKTCLKPGLRHVLSRSLTCRRQVRDQKSRGPVSDKKSRRRVVTAMQCWQVFLPTYFAVFSRNLMRRLVRWYTVSVSVTISRRPHQPPLATCSRTHWVQAGHADVQTSAQSSTKLPRASRTCCRCAWSSTTPLRQHWLPGDAACQAVICRQPSFPGCCTSRVEQPASQSYICSVTVFIPATTENIFVSTIFSGRHSDTLVDLAMVFFLLRPL